jgi:hypothetical protein
MTHIEFKSMALYAETLAIQAVLTNVLNELKLLDPILADAVARGFDAASQVENFAIQAGKTAPPEHLVKALGMIGDLRTASLGRHDEARHIV